MFTEVCCDFFFFLINVFENVAVNHVLADNKREVFLYSWAYILLESGLDSLSTTYVVGRFIHVNC